MRRLLAVLAVAVLGLGSSHERLKAQSADGYFVHTFAEDTVVCTAADGSRYFVTVPLHTSEGPLEAAATEARTTQIATEGLHIGTIWLPLPRVRKIEVRPAPVHAEDAMEEAVMADPCQATPIVEQPAPAARRRRR